MHVRCYQVQTSAGLLIMRRPFRIRLAGVHNKVSNDLIISLGHTILFANSEMVKPSRLPMCPGSITVSLTLKNPLLL